MGHLVPALFNGSMNKGSNVAYLNLSSNVDDTVQQLDDFSNG